MTFTTGAGQAEGRGAAAAGAAGFAAGGAATAASAEIYGRKKWVDFDVKNKILVVQS